MTPAIKPFPPALRQKVLIGCPMPAHTMQRPRLRQSAINAGDPDALARLYEMTGHGPVSLVNPTTPPDLRAKAQAGMGSRHD